jgi:dTDP-6-deoxy-L-talose 4-dehydrogenase (NAD+)
MRFDMGFKRILVTGSTGYLGSKIVKKLLADNYSVIATGIENKEDVSHAWKSDVEYIQCDINREHDNYLNIFHKPDILIHLAWEGLPNYKNLFHFEKNLPLQYRFLKNIISHGLTDITITGTCFEYGLKNGCLSEDIETSPVTAYGLAKDALRKFLFELKKNVQFECKWLRLFYLAGKDQPRSSLLAQLQNAIENNQQVFNMSGGEQLRDYLSIDTAIDYITKIALIENYSGIINCCSGQPTSVMKLVNDYIMQSGLKIELNPGYYPYPDYEPMAFWGDNSKLNQLLKPIKHKC